MIRLWYIYYTLQATSEHHLKILKVPEEFQSFIIGQIVFKMEVCGNIMKLAQENRLNVSWYKHSNICNYSTILHLSLKELMIYQYQTNITTYSKQHGRRQLEFQTVLPSCRNNKQRITLPLTYVIWTQINKTQHVATL